MTLDVSLAQTLVPSVYLAGPIRGLTYGATSDWRKEVQKELLAAGIISFSPMRHRFEKVDTEMPYSDEGSVLSSTKGIMTRDRLGIEREPSLF